MPNGLAPIPIAIMPIARPLISGGVACSMRTGCIVANPAIPRPAMKSRSSDNPYKFENAKAKTEKSMMIEPTEYRVPCLLDPRVAITIAPMNDPVPAAALKILNKNALTSRTSRAITGTIWK